MMKVLKMLYHRDREKYSIPRTVRDLIPIRNVWEDGIFQVGNRFSKTYKFTDINYYVAGLEEKRKIFTAYSELINGLDSSAVTKITINNRRMNQETFHRDVLIPLRGDSRDEYRQEYNQVLLNRAEGASGLVQEKYITISIGKSNVEEARIYFNRIGADLTSHLAVLGSKCIELSAVERLHILKDFYCGESMDCSDEDIFAGIQNGTDCIRSICPEIVEKRSDHLKIDGRYCRVFFLKSYAAYIRDDILTELTGLKSNMMLSVDIIPVPMEEAVREVEKRLLGVETNITNWQRKQIANNNYGSEMPYDMAQQRQELREFLDDLTTRDQRMMFALVTIAILSDSKQELESDTEALLSVAREKMCEVSTLKYQQIDGLNTVLPFGSRKIDVFRTLLTESLAVFMPFKVQEICDRGGEYLGENAVSHNLILSDRQNLMNQSAFLLGVPGSGKSFLAKLMIVFLILATDEDVIICDPENEFVQLIEALAGDLSAVVQMAAGGKDRLNAMYMVDGYGENDPLVTKAQFVMSLIEQIDREGIGPQHKSIIDRCVAEVYREAEQRNRECTLCDLRDKLLQQQEEIAQEIALSMELFTTGSLNIFGHESTVDLDKRVVVFDIHGLGSQLKPVGSLVITDTILNRVALNSRNGKRTHVFIDEFHVMFENEYSAAFFDSAWRQFRKRNAYPTAITQNVEYLLDSVQASTMLSNSEFVIMMNQAAADREKLARLLNISEEQVKYITNADTGCGLIKYGSSLVPFVNQFPRETKLYRLMTTKPNEGFTGK